MSAPLPSRRPPPGAASRRVRVLLVEDNPGDARLVSLELSRESPDFAVTTVARLSDALARLRAGDVDVVLADLGLPDSFGLRTAQRLVEAAGDVPVLVLTGLDDEAMGLQALQHGAQDFLVKGRADGRAIGRAIRYALERLHARPPSADGASGGGAAAQALLDHVLDAATEGLVLVDAEGVVRVANSAAARLLGVPEPMVGARFPVPFSRLSGVASRATGAAGRELELRTTGLEWEGRPAHLVTVTDVAERERDGEAARRAAAEAEAARDRVKVVVVDPDEAARGSVARTLESRGCRVLEARDGGEAVRIVGALVGPTVVLTDVGLPDMGSFEFAQSVRAASGEARILVASFHPKDDLVRRGLLRPDEPYLRRPFSAEDLAAAVDEASRPPPPDASTSFGFARR
jgi:DNA-binding response OmpR family regulator